MRDGVPEVLRGDLPGLADLEKTGVLQFPGNLLLVVVYVLAASAATRHEHRGYSQTQESQCGADSSVTDDEVGLGGETVVLIGSHEVHDPSG